MKKWIWLPAFILGCGTPTENVDKPVPSPPLDPPEDVYRVTLVVPSGPIAGPFFVEATPTPPGKTLQVQFFVDEQPIAIDITEPFGVEIQSTMLTEGAHVVSAFAESIDKEKAQATSKFLIDNVAPRVTLAHPLPNSTTICTAPVLAKFVSVDEPSSVVRGFVSIDDAISVEMDVPTLTAALPLPHDIEYPAKHVLHYAVADEAGNERHDEASFELTRERFHANLNTHDAVVAWSNQRTLLVQAFGGTVLNERGDVELSVAPPVGALFAGVRAQEQDTTILGLSNAAPGSGVQSDALQALQPDGSMNWRIPMDFAQGGFLDTAYDRDSKRIVGSRVYSAQYEQTGSLVEVTLDGQEAELASLEPFHVARYLSLSAQGQVPSLVGLETVNTQANSWQYAMYDRKGVKLWSGPLPTGDGAYSGSFVLDASTAAAVFTNIQTESFEVKGFGAAGSAWTMHFGADWPKNIFPIAPGDVVVAAESGHVVRIRPDGSVAWDRKLTSVVRAVPYGDEVWIAQYTKLECLSLATGQTIREWKPPKKLGDPSLDLAIVYGVPAQGAGFFATYSVGSGPVSSRMSYVHRVDAAGQVLWRQTVTGVYAPLSTHVVEGGDAFVFWTHNDGNYSVGRYADNPTF